MQQVTQPPDDVLTREPGRTATEAEGGEQTVDPNRPEPTRTHDHPDGYPVPDDPPQPERGPR